MPFAGMPAASASMPMPVFDTTHIKKFVLWRLTICPYFYLPKLAEAFSAVICLPLTKMCWERAPKVAMCVGPATVSSVEVATRLPTAAKIARKKTGQHTRPTAASCLPCKWKICHCMNLIWLFFNWVFTIVRHVTGTGSGLLGGIPRVVVQISALTLKGPLFHILNSNIPYKFVHIWKAQRKIFQHSIVTLKSGYDLLVSLSCQCSHPSWRACHSATHLLVQVVYAHPMLPGETPVWSESIVDECNLYFARSAIIRFSGRNLKG